MQASSQKKIKNTKKCRVCSKSISPFMTFGKMPIANAFLKKKAAAQNPWGEGATTLEWTVPSPPNFHTFEELPKFVDDQDREKSPSQ